MRTIALAFAAALVAGQALAQPAPPATPPVSPPPGAPSADNPTPPPPPRDGRPGRGAFIKMQAPGGAEISVRCADGDSTRACADIVVQLLERTRSSSGERRRDWSDRGGDMGSYRGGGEHRGDRDRDRDND